MRIERHALDTGQAQDALRHIFNNAPSVPLTAFRRIQKKNVEGCNAGPVAHPITAAPAEIAVYFRKRDQIPSALDQVFEYTAVTNVVAAGA